MARRKPEPARVLFHPKDDTDPRLTDAAYYGRVDDSPSISSHQARAVRCRSADISAPRYVAGQSKAITAEGYYSTCTWTPNMLAREQKRRY